MKQTVKVSVADIRSFKKNSSHIKRNNILPILDFIKFDNGKKNMYYNYNRQTKLKSLIDKIDELLKQLYGQTNDAQ